MKTAEEVLQPYVETPFRHARVVEKDNALLAMKKFADQFNEAKWVAMKDKKPDDYERVLYIDSRDNAINIGYFVWSQSAADYVTYWMKLPEKP